MKTPLICAVIALCIGIAGYMDKQAFNTCKNQTAVSYEECLAAHGIS